jgi:hypothetical protein
LRLPDNVLLYGALEKKFFFIVKKPHAMHVEQEIALAFLNKKPPTVKIEKVLPAKSIKQ